MFVWRSFNKETLQRDWIITADWFNYFRKWLDIAWWTKLVYKIDYSKYEEIYSPSDLAVAKKSIEEVILKNIDSRISSLWVSDYRSYIQKLADETQIVVEIWGIADLDQAKEIIGKTVELEFRLANEDEVTPETIAERRELADKARSAAVLNPDQMIELYETKASENIYAQTISWTLSVLPEIYKDNVALLDSIPLNQISNVIEGTYTTSSYQTEDWDIASEDVNWFLIFRVTWRDNQEKATYTPSDIVSYANQQGLSYDVTNAKDDRGVAQGEYKFDGNTLVYSLWTSADKDKKAYDVRIIQIDRPSALWVTWDEAELVSADFDTRVSAVQAALKANPEWEIQTWVELVNSYLTEESLESYVGEYEPALNDVKVYTAWSSAYVVYTKGVKEEGEDVYSFVEIKDIPDTASF